MQERPCRRAARPPTCSTAPNHPEAPAALRCDHRRAQFQNLQRFATAKPPPPNLPQGGGGAESPLSGWPAPLNSSLPKLGRVKRFPGWRSHHPPPLNSSLPKLGKVRVGLVVTKIPELSGRDIPQSLHFVVTTSVVLQWRQRLKSLLQTIARLTAISIIS